MSARLSTRQSCISQNEARTAKSMVSELRGVNVTNKNCGTGKVHHNAPGLTARQPYHKAPGTTARQPCNLSTRKQRFPQPKFVEDDEDDLSNVSDYEEEDMKSSFNYSLMNLRATSAAGGGGRCSWCSRLYSASDYSLATQDRDVKTFCSEDCQDSFKADILRTKVCEWCKSHFPSKTSLIAVEPSPESVPLQFCTQTCMNKYKMELFCVEVKEQLRRIKEENVQLPMKSTKQSHPDRKILITPELWNEGESALIFIDDPAKQGKEGTKDSCGNTTGSDRKRKGDSVENVISKISRRSHRYTLRTPDELLKPPSNSQQGNNQPAPINLTLQRTQLSSEDKSRPNKTANPELYGIEKAGQQTFPPIRREQSMPAIIPIPILLPIPIPIPITLENMSKFLLKQSTEKPVAKTNDKETLNTRQNQTLAEDNHLVADDPE
ncbi:Sobp [Bugula neritina]|uniref:Sobp n=1 Tax=Bugula neritina TaxID=10212 RepID=A0A7J7KJL1_BUGNE|nr:Sobp [Bugula neritina]